MDNPKYTRREALREVFVPYTINDAQREALLTTMVEEGKKVDLIVKAITKLKEKVKDPLEKYESAIAAIQKGKPVKTPCWEYFDWKNKKIIVTRQDNGDIISEEEISAKSVPLAIGDEEVDEIPETTPA
jgi:hypothetical protein